MVRKTTTNFTVPADISRLILLELNPGTPNAQKKFVGKRMVKNLIGKESWTSHMIPIIRSAMGDKDKDLFLLPTHQNELSVLS